MPLLPGQRQRIILDQLRCDGAVETTPLAQQLGVSTVTARRDLDALISRGVARRVHGGAVLAEPELPVTHRTRRPPSPPSTDASTGRFTKPQLSSRRASQIRSSASSSTFARGTQNRLPLYAAADSIVDMDPTTRANRAAWETASQKYVREYDDILAGAAAGTSLFDTERALLKEILAAAPAVVHPQSGHGQDDIALVNAGARHVLGVDYSETTVRAAQSRADDLGANCRYLIAAVPGLPLRDGCADLVYTGKGALIWMPDLNTWAAEMARLLRPGGHLFIHEGHPAVQIWAWDGDEPRIRSDRSYFGRSYVNDTFPGYGAVEWQWTLGQIVTAVVEAGLEVERLEEYAEPFWCGFGLDAAARSGRLPHSFALLARRPTASEKPSQ
jgi:SAM-dependent methyltransferase